MAKKSSDGMLDAFLTKLATSTTLTVCAGEPISHADIAARKLASATISGASFTIANGDVNGRKTTIASQVDMAITVGGTADHVVIDDGTDYEVTTCTSQALISGGAVTAPAFSIEIADPV